MPGHLGDRQLRQSLKHNAVVSCGATACVLDAYSGHADVLALRARGATRSARISWSHSASSSDLTTASDVAAAAPAEGRRGHNRRRPRRQRGGVSRRGHLLGRGQLVATPSSSVTDFGCDCWCYGQNRSLGRVTWAAGGLLNVVRWARSGRRDLLLGSGVGGGDADEDGGPGAKWSPVLSELG